ncbi:unnamed protein product [Owenia fusiformis]|uniref:uS12 prolyl 3-hydroxylase n=1 Tax=Owenia fusiformis TaxID=6347 RepID=A0A8J1U9U4_OWEFU|nr:unnamed protein product [Owenia fusiformis]
MSIKRKPIDVSEPSTPVGSPVKRQSTGKHKQKSIKSPQHVQLNELYNNSEYKSKLGHSFKTKASLTDDCATLHNDPFMCCVLPDFLDDPQFLDGLQNEMEDQIYYQKNNDLYKFQQSDDLKKCKSPHIKALRKLLSGSFVQWLRDVTGIPLSSKIDMTCSRYDHTDTLLCHDDELEGRRIAFILYLVPVWSKEDGGTLDLFNMDEYGQPNDIVKSIIPCRNTFAFFEVTEASHHQVSEVLAEGKVRLSVNGWFHGPNIPRPKRHIEVPRPLEPHIPTEEDILYEWVNPIYLDINVQSQIQEKFEEDSEIELKEFIKEEKYQQLVQEMKDHDVEWEHIGPPNKRNYNAANVKTLPSLMRECIKLFQSEMMFLTLSNMTGLSFHALAPSDSESDDEPDTESDNLGEASKESVKANTERQDSSVMDTGLEHTEPDTDHTIDATHVKVTQRQDSSIMDTNDTHNTGTAIERQDSSVMDTSESMGGHNLRSRARSTSSSECNVSVKGKSKTKKDAGEGKKKNSKEKAPKNPRCHGELRKWQHGDYTLVHDTDSEGAEFALDANFFCCCKGWKQEYGGFTSYITKGEDEELLTVQPLDNSLALVYRDKQSLKFVKHINSLVKQAERDHFYDISFVYYE